MSDTAAIIEALNGTIRELTALYRVEQEIEGMQCQIIIDEAEAAGEMVRSEVVAAQINAIYSHIVALALGEVAGHGR
jgi:hypothetical protein